MNFIKPENSNFTFGAGHNPNTGDLDVTMSYREDIPGRVFGVSVWEVSDEELAEIIRTRRVYLSTMGAGMLPVSVLAFDPFQSYGYYPAVVTEHTDEQSGRVYKLIDDPREGDQFVKWMDMIAKELETRPFFRNRDKTPLSYAPWETFMSMYRNGAMVNAVADSLHGWLEDQIARKN
jgi:hypothetical protein